jgi:hypothetical protein
MSDQTHGIQNRYSLKQLSTLTSGKDQHVASQKSKPAKDQGPSCGRRAFLKATAASVALPYLIPASALGNGGNAAPSNRIVMAGIGLGNMGGGDLESFLGRDDVQYVAVCDVKRDVRDGRMNLNGYATRTAKPITTSVRFWHATISTRCIAPRRITGTRS